MSNPLIRYGMKLRRIVADINRQKKKKYTCPTCGKNKVRRAGFALYVCSSCKATYAGAAYSLSSNLGDTVKGLIAQHNATKKQ